MPVTSNIKYLPPFHTPLFFNNIPLYVVLIAYFIILFIDLIYDSIVQLIIIEHSITTVRISSLNQRIICNILTMPDM